MTKQEALTFLSNYKRFHYSKVDKKPLSFSEDGTCTLKLCDKEYAAIIIGQHEKRVFARVFISQQKNARLCYFYRNSIANGNILEVRNEENKKYYYCQNGELEYLGFAQ